MRKLLIARPALIALATAEKQTDNLSGAFYGALGRYLRETVGVKVVVLSAGQKAARILGEVANFNTVYFQIKVQGKITAQQREQIVAAVDTFTNVRRVHIAKWESKNTEMGRVSEAHLTRRVLINGERRTVKRYGITKFVYTIC